MTARTRRPRAKPRTKRPDLSSYPRASGAAPPLRPVPFGEPDRKLGEAICRQWLPAMMPATPWSPPAPSPPMVARATSVCGWCLVGGLALLALVFLGARAHHGAP